MAPKKPGRSSENPPFSILQPPGAISEKKLDDLRQQFQRIEEDDRKAADFLDRVTLIGGTTAIIASLTFLKDFAPQLHTVSLWSLISSWILFLMGAALALLSLYTTRLSARAFSRMLAGKIAAGDPQIKSGDYDPIRLPNQITRWSSRAGLICFVAGATTLVIFAITNLSRKAAAEKQPVANASTPAARDTLLDRLVTDCLRERCILIYGYDYDLPPRPRSAVQQDGSATPDPGPPAGTRLDTAGRR